MKSIDIAVNTPHNPMMPPFTLRQLEQFVAIADAGSLSGAATETHLSASALARSLDELERGLGVVLCTRRKAHGIRLTADGRALLRQSMELLNHARELELAVTSQEGLSGPLVLGCYVTLAPTVLPVLIQAFSDAHPKVKFEFIEGSGDELQSALDAGRIDGAILYDRDVVGDYATTTLYQMRPHVLLASDHRLAGAPHVSIQDLAGEPAVLLDVAPAAQHTLSLFAAASTTLTIAYRTSSYELTRALVARGLGFAVLIQRTRADVSYEGRAIVIKELEPAPPPVGIVLARTHWNGRNARIDALESFARAHAELFQPPGLA